MHVVEGDGRDLARGLGAGMGDHREGQRQEQGHRQSQQRGAAPAARPPPGGAEQGRGEDEQQAGADQPPCAIARFGQRRGQAAQDGRRSRWSAPARGARSRSPRGRTPESRRRRRARGASSSVPIARSGRSPGGRRHPDRPDGDDRGQPQQCQPAGDDIGPIGEQASRCLRHGRRDGAHVGLGADRERDVPLRGVAVCRRERAPQQRIGALLQTRRDLDLIVDGSEPMLLRAPGTSAPV